MQECKVEITSTLNEKFQICAGHPLKTNGSTLYLFFFLFKFFTFISIFCSSLDNFRRVWRRFGRTIDASCEQCFWSPVLFGRFGIVRHAQMRWWYWCIYKINCIYANNFRITGIIFITTDWFVNVNKKFFFQILWLLT